MYVRYQVLGQTQVAVPTHFFKILLIEKGQDLEIKSFVMPNSEAAEGIGSEFSVDIILVVFYWLNSRLICVLGQVITYNAI